MTTAPLADAIDAQPRLFPRIRAGDAAAFEALFRALHEPLVRFAARYTGDVARAEELVQDLFFELWRNRDALTARGSERAYLFTAVRNRGLNVRRRDAVESDWSAHEAAADATSAFAAQTDAADVAESDELRRRLAAAVARLPGRCALVMQLRWDAGLRHAEIATALGITTKGVEAQLARGLRLLRAALGVT